MNYLKALLAVIIWGTFHQDEVNALFGACAEQGKPCVGTP